MGRLSKEDLYLQHIAIAGGLPEDDYVAGLHSTSCSILRVWTRHSTIVVTACNRY